MDNFGHAGAETDDWDLLQRSDFDLWRRQAFFSYKFVNS